MSRCSLGRWGAGAALITVRRDKSRGAAGKLSVSEKHVGNKPHHKSTDAEADWQLVQLQTHFTTHQRRNDVSFLTRILVSTMTNNVYCNLMMYSDWIIWCSYAVLMYACIFIVHYRYTVTPCLAKAFGCFNMNNHVILWSMSSLTFLTLGVKLTGEKTAT